MKLRLLTVILSIPCLYFAQDNKKIVVSTTNSEKIQKFNNQSRQFKDWVLSIGGGTAVIHNADLTSLNSDRTRLGWNAYLELNKQITNKFALILQYQMGQTQQSGRLAYNTWGLSSNAYGLALANTKYHQLSLLADFNFSNLFRRIDNPSPYRWALHGYAGIGLQGYHYARNDEKPLSRLPNGTYINETFREFTQPFRIDSFFYQGGMGLLYNVSKNIDLEARVMYILTGDDEFDGGGETPNEWPGYNQIIKNTSDNLVTANLGISFKLGKHPQHLRWQDAQRDALQHLIVLENNLAPSPCKKGDQDQDGVCDDWDKQPNTPLGARVDGSGKAMDLDLDGVLDLEDKCPTVAGLATLSGCPPSKEENTVPEEVYELEGIEFELNKDIIRPQSFEKLNRAAEILKKTGNTTEYYLVGGTDTRASDAYNFDLSKRRAMAVKKYLVELGVNPSTLITEGRGKKDLRYPECDPATKCPEWKNEANRRVYFKKK